MKTKLLVIPVMTCLIAPACAQTQVEVYGIVSGTVRQLTNADSAGNSRLSQSSVGWYEQNRWGFKGAEKIGEDMDAHFVLEGGFNAGTGGLDNTSNRIWNRIATVGIKGKWGTVDVGHNYTITHNLTRNFDPFLYRFVSLTPLGPSSAGAKVDNDIRYTGGFGPVTVRAEYSMGEVAGSTSNGSLAAVSLLYVNGPLTLGGAYTKRKPNIGTIAAPEYRHNGLWVVGGAYVIGFLRFAGGYMDEVQRTATIDNTVRNAWGGVNVNITPLLQL